MTMIKISELIPILGQSQKIDSGHRFLAEDFYSLKGVVSQHSEVTGELKQLIKKLVDDRVMDKEELKNHILDMQPRRDEVSSPNSNREVDNGLLVSSDEISLFCLLLHMLEETLRMPRIKKLLKL